MHDESAGLPYLVPGMCSTDLERGRVVGARRARARLPVVEKIADGERLIRGPIEGVSDFLLHLGGQPPSLAGANHHFVGDVLGRSLDQVV